MTFKKIVYCFIIATLVLLATSCKSDKTPDVVPTKLTDRHELNNFVAYENNDDLTVVHAYGLEPYVSFKVIIGANIHIESYDYETAEGIKYNVTLLEDGMYQAYWSHQGDYYTFVIDDKDVLTNVMENLQES